MTGQRFAVVGGGFSGIAAAHHLRCAGHEVELFERDDVLGGRCGPDRLGERPIMLGGKNIGRRYHELRAFVAEAGPYEYEPFGINSAQIIDGRPRTLDNPGVLALIRHLLRLGSPADVAKMLTVGALVRLDERNRYLGTEVFDRIGLAADGRALDHHFTGDFTRDVVRPLSLRLNAAEPDEVFMGAFGVSLGMVMDRYDQLVEGIQPVLDWFAGRVTVRLRTPVREVLIRDGRVRGLMLGENGTSARLREFDAVVVATPAWAAARLLEFGLPALGSLLDSVRYFPSTVAVVRYARPFFGSEIRSLALDSGPCSAVGVYGANDRDIVRYTFSGRAARPLPERNVLDGWIEEAESRVRRDLGLAEVPRLEVRSRGWSAAHCAYVPYGSRFRAGVRESLATVTGLQLAGDYLAGAQLEACFRSGRLAAEQLLERSGRAPIMR
ncbi:FAD-dependent oxidoreductase [Nocardia sp. NPDC127579]|uniref:FAD-dependent oxidoreductase n=1 Tax=Nocardia sp. NPDC127579 TaxID=3345402 RepID=UPI003642315A